MCIDVALDRRRRATHHHPTVVHRCRHNGRIARIVTRCGVVLFVARIVLLVDHNQARVRQRQQQRRARADNQSTRRRTQQTQVDIGAACVGEFRVVGHHALAKIATQTGDQLLSQCDLWHQHHHIATLAQRLMNQMDIYFGFARSRNSVQQYATLLGVLLLDRAQSFGLRL